MALGVPLGIFLKKSESCTIRDFIALLLSLSFKIKNSVAKRVIVEHYENMFCKQWKYLSKLIFNINTRLYYKNVLSLVHTDSCNA